MLNSRTVCTAFRGPCSSLTCTGNSHDKFSLDRRYGHHRGLLRRCTVHWPPFPQADIKLDRVLSRRPECGMDRDRSIALCDQYFQRTLSRTGGDRLEIGARGGALRVARHPDPSASGLGLHSILSPLGCLYHARVSGAPLWFRLTLLPQPGLDRRVRPHEDFHCTLCGRNTPERALSGGICIRPLW